MSSLLRNVERLQCVPQVRLVTIIVLASLILVGCMQPQQKHDSKTITATESSQQVESEIIPIPEKLPCTKQCEAEIYRLKKQLKEKSDLIRSYQTQLKDQKPSNNESVSEATQAQTKLHRLASQPSAASKIAEVEAETENLKQSLLIRADRSDQLLFNHSQQLLSAASQAYEKNDYAASMILATQSQAIIEMLKNTARKLVTQSTIYPLKTVITVRAPKNSLIFVEPATTATLLEKLQKDTTFTANAYWANWLRVQTQSGQVGWIDSAHTQINIPISN